MHDEKRHVHMTHDSRDIQDPTKMRTIAQGDYLNGLFYMNPEALLCASNNCSSLHVIKLQVSIFLPKVREENLSTSDLWHISLVTLNQTQNIQWLPKK